MSFDYTLTVGAITAGVIIAAIIVGFLLWRRGKKKEQKEVKPNLDSDLKGYPFRISKSVPVEDASNAKEELRTLDLEREILSDAIRRLYEAHAEGKITEQERERMAQSYKARMMTVKDAITKDESVVALHELEGMQQDLMKLFSERFDDLSKKIEELRERTDLQPIKEVTITPKSLTTETSAPEEKPTDEERAKRKRRAPAAKPNPKTEAERRIEEIRAEVEKVLDKLGQMEIES